MSTALYILDVVGVLLVVINVSGSIWKGPAGTTPSALLAIVLTLCMLLVGFVFLMAAQGLTEGSGIDQTFLVIVLVAIAGLTRLWRTRTAH